jgi:hypothetical protein
LYCYQKFEALQYDGTNIAAFQGFAPGLTVSASGDNMLCQKDGGEYVVEPGGYVIRRPGGLHFVTESDYNTWWGTV